MQHVFRPKYSLKWGLYAHIINTTNPECVNCNRIITDATIFERKNHSPVYYTCNACAYYIHVEKDTNCNFDEQENSTLKPTNNLLWVVHNNHRKYRNGVNYLNKEKTQIYYQNYYTPKILENPVSNTDKISNWRTQLMTQGLHCYKMIIDLEKQKIVLDDSQINYKHILLLHPELKSKAYQLNEQLKINKQPYQKDMYNIKYDNKDNLVALQQEGYQLEPATEQNILNWLQQQKQELLKQLQNKTNRKLKNE